LRQPVVNAEADRRDGVGQQREPGVEGGVAEDSLQVDRENEKEASRDDRAKVVGDHTRDERPVRQHPQRHQRRPPSAFQPAFVLHERRKRKQTYSKQPDRRRRTKRIELHLADDERSTFNQPAVLST